MLIQVLILLAGLCLVVFGADFLVDGSSSLARRVGLSEFVIGLTIVGIGTSTPEMVVSFMGAIEGNSDVSVGNIVGSNIFNTLLILGVTALLSPIGVSAGNLKRDIPLNIGVSVLLILLGLDFTIFGYGENALSRIDGLVFVVLFVAYLIFSFRSGSSENEETASDAPPMKVGPAILAIAGGLAALVFGGKLFVNSAVGIARDMGISDKFIAITVLAGGTSLPELATTVVAALKKKDRLALGNIIGSNISNVLLILGGSALIRPLSLASMNAADAGIFVLAAVLIGAGAFAGKASPNGDRRLGRGTGAVFLCIFAAYMAWLIINL